MKRRSRMSDVALGCVCVGIALGLALPSLAQEQAPDEAPPLEASTHEQVATIAVPLGDQPVEIHTLCVTREGNLLAACGGDRLVYRSVNGSLETETVQEPSGIRVIGPDGKLRATWSLDVTPQAMNEAPDGSIYVAGQGKIARLDSQGKVLRVTDAPQLSELPALPEIPEETTESPEDPTEKEAKAARIAELEKKIVPLQESLQEAYRAVGEAKDDKKASEEATAKFETIMEEYREVATELRELQITPRQRAIQERASLLRGRSVSGVAVSDRDVFVACPAMKGYGYDVWRLDRNLEGPKKIVTRLSGCCGQMDIQTKDGKLYAAENGRYRVARYDRDGNVEVTWGGQERDGVEGFGSCCNPMNVRFGADGNLYTSEASVGRIKRYTPDGKFLGVIGTARIVPGCKHVAIGMDAQGKRFYMLDITRNQIIVMEQKAEVVREF